MRAAAPTASAPGCVPAHPGARHRAGRPSSRSRTDRGRTPPMTDPAAPKPPATQAVAADAKTPDLATELGGLPGTQAGPAERGGAGPNVEAQNETLPVPRPSDEIGLVATSATVGWPSPLDPEQKVNSGQ